MINYFRNQYSFKFTKGIVRKSKNYDFENEDYKGV